MFRLKPDARALMRSACLAIAMSVESCNGTSLSEPTYYQQMVAETRRAFSHNGYEVNWTTMAPASNGVDVVAVSSSYGAYLRVSKYSANTMTWSASGGGGVQPDSSGDVKAAHIQLLPPQSGNTHTLVYQINGATTIYQRRTPDDGATWSSQTSVINDPALMDGPTPVILTRSGRMWVFYPFNDGSTYYGIRAVYSDTYGDSWDTNGGSGYDVITRAYNGDAFIAPQDATETDDGRIALLCADQTASLMTTPFMVVLLTESTLSATWDPGGDIASAPVSGPDTVRIYGTDGTPVYNTNAETYQPSSIQALPGDSFVIVAALYGDPDLKTIGAIASMGNARVDADISSRRTLEILDETELNWIADSLHVSLTPNSPSARLMPGGTLMVLMRRTWNYTEYDSLKVKICDSPRVLTFQPACWADLNP